MSDKPFPEHMSIGQKYGPAMEIHDQAEADAYFERCVQHMLRFNKSREEAEELERGNLGYYAGYYNAETRERVERLFRCSHPVFGSIAQKGEPTAEQAFSAGARMAYGGKAMTLPEGRYPDYIEDLEQHAKWLRGEADEIGSFGFTYELPYETMRLVLRRYADVLDGDANRLGIEYDLEHRPGVLRAP